MNKEKNNCIFISANKSFIEPLKVCLSSIVQNYSNHPEIILCHTDFTQRELIKLFQITKKIIPIVNNLSPDEIWPIMGHLPESIDPKVFYARFLLRKWWIFDTYKNVLHLDADTLVLKDLNQLMNYNDFYSVQEVYSWNDMIFKDPEDTNLLHQLSKDNISIGKTSSNGGIFLLPPHHRTIENYNEIMNILSTYGPYIKRADQSVINIRMSKHNISIQNDFTYNFQHRLIENPVYTPLIQDAHILHFNGVDDRYRTSCMKKFLDIYTTDNYIEKYKAYYNLHKW